MDDFDDLMSSGRAPPEGLASHRPAPPQPQQPQHGFYHGSSGRDLFGDSSDTLGLGPSGGGAGARRGPGGAGAGAQSHVLVDADDPDLMGDEEEDDFGFGSRTTGASLGRGYPPPGVGGAGMRQASYNSTGGASLAAPHAPFGSHAGASQDSGLPLSYNAQMPAGYSDSPFSDAYAGAGGAGAAFKSIEADDEPYDAPMDMPRKGRAAGGGAQGRSQTLGSGAAGQSRKVPKDSPFDGLNRSLRTLRADAKKLMGGKKAKDKLPEGERVIRLNDPVTNDKEGFGDNWISTSKFNIVSFLPKFFYGESQLL